MSSSTRIPDSVGGNNDKYRFIVSKVSKWDGGRVYVGRADDKSGDGMWFTADELRYLRRVLKKRIRKLERQTVSRPVNRNTTQEATGTNLTASDTEND